jgi:heme exporter protein D
VSAFLEMGGYAAYVWGAYGVAAVVLAGLVWQSLRSLRAQERDLAHAEEASPRRRARRAEAVR